MPEIQEDKKELATNRLLEILRGDEVETVKETVEEKIGLSQEEELALTEPVSEDDKREPILGKSKFDLSFKFSFKKVINDLIQKVTSLPLFNKGYLGIDFGTDTVKYVYLENVNKKYVMKDMGTRKIESKIPEDPEARKTFVSNTIKELVPKDLIKKSDISVSVYGPNVAIKKVNLPQLPKKEIKEAILWNVKKDLPFNADSAVYDFEILGPTTEAGVEKIEVLAAAVEKTIVDFEIDTFKALDADPVKIIPLQLAIYNNFINSVENIDQLNTVIIDIGATTSNIIFVSKGNLQFAREINAGGNAITEALIGTISTADGIVKIDRDEAERLKFVYGVPEADTTEYTERGISLIQINSMMRPAIERLLTQVQRSFDYFRSKFPNHEPDVIYLSGGSSLMKSFPKFLAEGLGKDVKVLNTFHSIDIDPALQDEKAPELVAPSLSVALGNVIAKAKGVNLITEELKQKAVLAIQKNILIAASVVMFIIMSVMTYFPYAEFGGLNETKIELDRQNVASPESIQVNELTTQLNDLQGLIDQNSNMMSNIVVDSDVVTYLKLLSVITPDHIALESISYTTGNAGIPGIMTIEGAIVDPGKATEVYLIEFYKDLRYSEVFSAVTNYEILEKPIEDEGFQSNILRFSIDCEIN